MKDNQHQVLFEKAKKVIPGGVHSPVRSFKGLNESPIFMKSGKGAYLTDVTEQKYIDFCMSFGPLILGHLDSDVFSNVKEIFEKVWTFGTAEPYSLELAEYIVEKINFIEKIRFVSSGTEAVMTAIRLARGYKNRDKIIKFNGCYHGHVDQMLIKAGSGLAGTAESSSSGVPKGVSDDTLILELGDIDAVKECIDDHKGQIAAIIIEPLPANNGLLPQQKSFLESLRKVTKENDILLIFDEVISGFRVSFGGMAEILGITPDIVTYGKIIGGGMPVGAIGSSSEIMDQLAPVGNVYQAGTLSANPLAMVAGLATLKKLTKDNYQILNKYSSMIVDIFSKWLKEFNNGQFKSLEIKNYNSLFWISPDNSLSRACDLPENLNDLFKELFSTLVAKGIYLSPNAYEVGFVSLAHDENVIKDLEEKLWK